MGYPITQFVDNPYLLVYTCFQCNNIAESPSLLECCEILVCDRCCIGIRRCPKCYKFDVDYDDDDYLDSKPLSGPSRKIYDMLIIKCSHSPSCSWIDSLSKLDSHLSNECNFHPLPCPNWRCNKKFVRTELEIHVKECEHRSCPCTHCKENIPFLEAGDHYAVCSSFPVCCPSECCSIMPRSSLEKHRRYCLSGIVQCPWSCFGCFFFQAEDGIRDA
eukprot:TRINITY_DN3081_c0_g1_i1.p1 TRINITY_DN3081_c0_g1~~TRINITY_DN3081_c0_g1_i1.p1  ORF type:complete len:217 (+),score=6.22 TRINITY_DN3081_c0_g1_i1:281-931(+)